MQKYAMLLVLLFKLNSLTAAEPQKSTVAPWDELWRCPLAEWHTNTEKRAEYLKKLRENLTWFAPDRHEDIKATVQKKHEDSDYDSDQPGYIPTVASRIESEIKQRISDRDHQLLSIVEKVASLEEGPAYIDMIFSTGFVPSNGNIDSGALLIACKFARGTTVLRLLKQDFYKQRINERGRIYGDNIVASPLGRTILGVSWSSSLWDLLDQEIPKKKLTQDRFWIVKHLIDEGADPLNDIIDDGTRFGDTPVAHMLRFCDLTKSPGNYTRKVLKMSKFKTAVIEEDTRVPVLATPRQLALLSGEPKIAALLQQTKLKTEDEKS